MLDLARLQATYRRIDIDDYRVSSDLGPDFEGGLELE
jgi:hypothetical protein